MFIKGIHTRNTTIALHFAALSDHIMIITQFLVVLFGSSGAATAAHLILLYQDIIVSAHKVRHPLPLARLTITTDRL